MAINDRIVSAKHEIYSLNRTSGLAFMDFSVSGEYGDPTHLCAALCSHTHTLRNHTFLSLSFPFNAVFCGTHKHGRTHTHTPCWWLWPRLHYTLFCTSWGSHVVKAAV